MRLSTVCPNDKKQLPFLKFYDIMPINFESGDKMSVLIVAPPLFDGKMTIKAHKMCDYNPSIHLDTKNDFRGKSQIYYMPGLELIQKIGLDPFSGDLQLFVDVNRFHILTGMFTNKNIPPEKLILVIPSDIDADNDLLTGLKGLKDLGYSMALDGYPKDGLNNPMFFYTDYIIFDYGDKNFNAQYNEVKKTSNDITIVISNIPSKEAYNKLSSAKNTLFTGVFYKNPVTESESIEISPLKVNALQLLKHISEEDYELKDIVKTIERDPALSISLLSFINTSGGLKNKVSSINNAVAYLGQKEVRRWATVAVSIGLSKDKPGEITKLSLVRAKFAENLAGLFELGIYKNSLFMTGLFSMLDLILDKPMEQAVNDVAIDDLVRETLLSQSGRLYKVMELIYNYERADWNKVSIFIIQNNLDGGLVGQAYIDALVWYHQLLTSIEESSNTDEDLPDLPKDK